MRGFAEREEANSNKAQKGLDRARAYAESRILRQDPDGFTVAVPLTEFAAKWWGRGTRWCTAAEKDNAFWRYHAKAPLFVILIPEVGKFQMWVADEGFQFMGADDRPITQEVLAEYWLSFEPLWLSLLRRSGLHLRWLPERLRTAELCQSAVMQNGLSLKFVPKALQTQELCRLAVAQNGEALQHVPPFLQTEDLCRIAITQTGVALQYVVKRLQNKRICQLAVTQNWAALQYVPVFLQNEELCRIAVAQNDEAFRLVPKFLCLTLEDLRPAAEPKTLWSLDLLDSMEDALNPISHPPADGKTTSVSVPLR